MTVASVDPIVAFILTLARERPERVRSAEGSYILGNERKRNIGNRFSHREDAERYRDRFKSLTRRWAHRCEVVALERALASIQEPIRIIFDVGSGTGRFAPVLKGHAARLILVDFSRHMLDVSREGFPLEGESGAYVQADARRLPFSDDCAELVFCHRLLNHVHEADDRRSILAELRRISRRYIVISCLTAPAWIRAIRRISTGLRRRNPVATAVATTLLLHDAIETGMKHLKRVPIRRIIAPCDFHILAKSIGLAVQCSIAF